MKLRSCSWCRAEISVDPRRARAFSRHVFCCHACRNAFFGNLGRARRVDPFPDLRDDDPFMGEIQGMIQFQTDIGATEEEMLEALEPILSGHAPVVAPERSVEQQERDRQARKREYLKRYYPWLR